MSDKNTLSRIPPRRIEDMRPEWLEILARIPGDGLKGRYAPVNVLGMLMYNPDTLGQFLDYWVTSKLKMGLTVREQELVILRMGVLYDCEYVWKHHVPVGREFGITDEEFDALRHRPVTAVFNPREEALLVLTDEMVERRDVNDAMYAKYREQLSDSELVDLISLVSQYVLFTLTNNVLRVQVEANLDGIPGLQG
jgi:4-carboxymuconolactone decarboxylase